MQTKTLGNFQISINGSAYTAIDGYVDYGVIETTRPGGEWATYRSGNRRLSVKLNAPLDPDLLAESKPLDVVVAFDAESAQQEYVYTGTIAYYEIERQSTVPTANLVIELSKKGSLCQ